MRRAIPNLACALLGALALGCGEDPPFPTDGGDVDGSQLDGGGDQAGLQFSFTSSEELPAQLGGEFEIELDSVTIVLEDVRAIGDAATGDDRTHQASLVLDWNETEAHLVTFADAPPGLYSRLTGGIASYELRGSVEIDGDRVPFVVSDAPSSLTFSETLPQETMLQPGSVLEIEVQVDVGDPLADVAWGGYSGQDSIEIDGDSSIIGDVGENLSDAIEVDDGDDD